MKKNSELSVFANQFYEDIQTFVIRRIDDHLEKAPSAYTKKILRYVQRHLKSLITEPLDQLKERVATDLSSFDQKLENDKIGVDFLIGALGYKKIREKYYPKYIYMMGYRSCPYCDSQYLLNLDGQYRLALCQMDHIEPKTKRPYLSISFFNLVPCCPYCNQRKSNKVFNVNPLTTDIFSKIKFKINPDDVISYFLQKSADLPRIDVVFDPNEGEIKRLINYLRLDEIYKNHRAIALSIFIKRLIYTTTFKQDLRTILSNCEITISDSELDFLILGFNTERRKKDLPLSKLSLDIWEDLGHDDYSINFQ